MSDKVFVFGLGTSSGIARQLVERWDLSDVRVTCPAFGQVDILADFPDHVEPEQVRAWLAYEGPAVVAWSVRERPVRALTRGRVERARAEGVLRVLAREARRRAGPGMGPIQGAVKAAMERSVSRGTLGRLEAPQAKFDKCCARWPECEWPVEHTFEDVKFAKFAPDIDSVLLGNGRKSEVVQYDPSSVTVTFGGVVTVTFDGVELKGLAVGDPISVECRYPVGEVRFVDPRPVVALAITQEIVELAEMYEDGVFDEDDEDEP